MNIDIFMGYDQTFYGTKARFWNKRYLEPRSSVLAKQPTRMKPRIEKLQVKRQMLNGNRLTGPRSKQKEDKPHSLSLS